MRFASLTLVLLAACSSGTPQAGVDRLIGTWAHIAVLPGCVERRPEQWVNEITAYVEKEGEDVTETFLPDGSWINRHQATSGVQPRWSLIEQDHERITVAIDAPIANGGRITRSFVFESPDLMREEHSRYAGMKLARVPPPK